METLFFKKLQLCFSSCGFLTCFLYFHVISFCEEHENKQKESIDWVTFLGFYRSKFLPGVSTLEFLEGVSVQKKYTF